MLPACLLAGDIRTAPSVIPAGDFQPVTRHGAVPPRTGLAGWKHPVGWPSPSAPVASASQAASIADRQLRSPKYRSSLARARHRMPKNGRCCPRDNQTHSGLSSSTPHLSDGCMYCRRVGRFSRARPPAAGRPCECWTFPQWSAGACCRRQMLSHRRQLRRNPPLTARRTPVAPALIHQRRRAGP